MLIKVRGKNTLLNAVTGEIFAFWRGDRVETGTEMKNQRQKLRILMNLIGSVDAGNDWI